MLSVSNEPIMVTIIMQNVAKLSVFVLNVVAPKALQVNLLTFSFSLDRFITMDGIIYCR
jgi:hypothetical protein